MAVDIVSNEYDLVIIADIDLLPIVASVYVAYHDMFHVTKLCSGVAGGGRLIANSVIAEVGANTLFMKVGPASAGLFAADAAELAVGVEEPKAPGDSE
jgi:hypothetical protein